MVCSCSITPMVTALILLSLMVAVLATSPIEDRREDNMVYAPSSDEFGIDGELSKELMENMIDRINFEAIRDRVLRFFLLRNQMAPTSINRGGLRMKENDQNEEVVRSVPSKRQLRYHQCYFNPISCFRKRK
ncbi:Uncharacterised protein g3762 [Pycnogonum litorale]